MKKKSVLSILNLRCRVGRLIMMLAVGLAFVTPIQIFGYAPSQNDKQVQQLKVTGKVTDSKTGEALPGVNVLVKGTTTGVLTDADGKYSVALPAKNATLVFSFIGYNRQEIAVTGGSNVDVALELNSVVIDEVVVIGYGTAKKSTLTGSVVSAKGSDVIKSPTTNLTNSLVGRLPGLTAINSTGEPGSDAATILIRGMNTLGNNSPLIVVDGIANRTMGQIPANDIETISVLKDASAAIYGAQAANGVIIITTKRGVIGKPRITISSNTGFSQPTVVPKLLNAFDYATAVNELNSYAGKSPTYSADDLQKYKDGSDQWEHPNTNFFKETLKPWSLQTNNNASISGGTENMKYYISLGSRFQDGNYKNSATNLKQYDFRTNIDGKISKNIDISFDASGSQILTNRSSVSSTGIYDALLSLKPTLRAYWPDGTPASGLSPAFGGSSNPVVQVTDEVGYNRTKEFKFQSNLKLNIKIPWIIGLSVQGNGSFDLDFNANKVFNKPMYLYTWDGQPDHLTTRGIAGSNIISLSQYNGDSQATTLNFITTYEHNFSGTHEIKIITGTERQKGNYSSLNASRRNFLSDKIDELFAGANDIYKDNTGSGSQYARLNYFGRANYSYRNKYLFEFVWRYDGSYKFPAGKQFGFFPGVSAGWRISEENFWKNNITFINDLKIRGSIGRTGNDKINDYQYLSSFGFSNPGYVFGDAEVLAMSELRIPNPNVTWEVANQSNIGFETSLFNKKMTIEADYFYNRRSNILWPRNASVPGLTGLTLPPENIGKVDNKGVEYTVTFRDKAGEFIYNISLNGSYTTNKIIFWDETPGVPAYQRSTGKPMGAGLYYQVTGVFKDQAAIDAYPHLIQARPGDLIFEDYNKDGAINDLDKVRNNNSSTPKFTGGLSLNMSYKQFDVAILFQGVAGGANYYQADGGTYSNYYQEDFDGRWTVDNPTTSKPRAYNGNIDYWILWNSNYNTYWLRNNDYLRLKNAEIGYNLPEKLNKMLGIAGFRMYLNGNNLLTFSKIKRVDPEMGANREKTYLVQRVVNAGLVLTF